MNFTLKITVLTALPNSPIIIEIKVIEMDAAAKISRGSLFNRVKRMSTTPSSTTTACIAFNMDILLLNFTTIKENNIKA